MSARHTHDRARQDWEAVEEDLIADGHGGDAQRKVPVYSNADFLASLSSAAKEACASWRARAYDEKAKGPKAKCLASEHNSKLISVLSLYALQRALLKRPLRKEDEREFRPFWELQKYVFALYAGVIYRRFRTSRTLALEGMPH